MRKALASGANVDAETRGITALMWAVATRNPNPEVVKILLTGKADIHVIGGFGRMALMLAARCNSNPEVVKVLLENGADVSHVDEDGHDALWYAQHNEEGDKEKIIQILKRY